MCLLASTLSESIMILNAFMIVNENEKKEIFDMTSEQGSQASRYFSNIDGIYFI